METNRQTIKRRIKKKKKIVAEDDSSEGEFTEETKQNFDEEKLQQEVEVERSV